MHDYLVRALRERQPRTFMAFLSAGLLAGRFAGVDDLPPDPVAGRRLAGIVTVGAQLLLKLLNLLRKSCNLNAQCAKFLFVYLLQVVYQRDDSVGPGSIRRKDLLTGYR
jgi:hypothetical protein